MLVTRNERIEAEQFIPGSEMPVLDLLGLNKEGTSKTMEGHVYVYTNENAVFRMYQPEVCSLYIKTYKDFNEYDQEVKPGDYVVKYSDSKGESFLVVSEGDFNKRYKEVQEIENKTLDKSDKDDNVNIRLKYFSNFSVTFHVDDKHMWCIKERMEDGMPFIVVYKNNEKSVFSDDNCVACSPLYKALEGIKLFPANVVATSPIGTY